jgi:hypothetical protein
MQMQHELCVHVADLDADSVSSSLSSQLATLLFVLGSIDFAQGAA